MSLIRHIFEAADEDGSGELTTAEFHDAFSTAGAREMMLRCGISINSDDDLREFFQLCDEDASGEITVEEVVQGYFRYRDPETGGDRAVTFIRHLFQQADADRSGSLTRLELRRVLQQQKVLEKLRMFGLIPSAGPGGGAGGGAVMGGEESADMGARGQVSADAISLDELKMLFDMLDEGGDGNITLDELTRGFLNVRETLRKTALAEAEQLWDAEAEKRSGVPRGDGSKKARPSTKPGSSSTSTSQALTAKRSSTAPQKR